MDSEVDYNNDPQFYIIYGYDWSLQLYLSNRLENTWHCRYRKVLPGINSDKECQNLIS